MRTIFIILLLQGCSWKSVAPTIMGGAGAGVGSLAGPGGSIVGGTLGAGAGQLIKELDENQEARATVKMLTEGDVQALVDHKVQNSGIEGFMQTVKKWLLISACLLGLYLMIPIFIAKRCSQTEAKKHQSRAPFPIKPK